MTCLGINNEGKLVFDYYHQDYGVNSTLGVQDVYNGKTSVLWTNFHEAFAEDIQTMYQSWRVAGSEKLSYNKMLKYFVTDHTDKWSISMYNEDAEFKYIAALRNNNNPEYLYQVRGTGEEHFKYFVKNRLMFCDSKWFTGDFVANTNRIVMRINTPVITGKFAPNPTISYKTFSNMYAAVRYGTNTNPLVQYTPRDELVSLGKDVSTFFHDTDTYIFGASEISHLDDLSRLYCSTLNISAASKLIELNVGCDDPSYENPNLKQLSFTNNRLLKKVNVCNCTGFGSDGKSSKILDFSLCPDIQEVLATGSNITSINLPDSGYLKIAKLPASIDTIKLIKQKHIQTFECASYENLKSIRIEDSVNVPVTEILSAIQDDSYPNVRIVNMDWNAASTSELSRIVNKLSQCKALDASGLAITDTAIVTGRVYVNDTVSDELRAFVHQHFPDLVVVDKTGNTFYYVDYLTIDGHIFDTELISADETPKGPDTTPEDIIMDDHRYLFKGWDMSSFKKNQNNRISGNWQEQFAVAFYADTTDINWIWRDWANKGDPAQDPVLADKIEVPTKASTSDIRYEFKGWDNLPTNIQMATRINAVYTSIYPVRYYATDDTTIPHYEQWIKDGESAYDPIIAGECNAPDDIVMSDKSLKFVSWIDIPTNVTSVCNVYCQRDTYWAAKFLNDGVVHCVEWIRDGSNAVDPKNYFGDYEVPTRKPTAQYQYTFTKWNGNFTALTESRDYTAEYSATVRQYTVYFYNGTTLLKTVPNVTYGTTTSYTGSTPVKTDVGNPEEYVFKGWSPDATTTPITGETKCYAVFKFTGYLFGQLGKTDAEDQGYGTIDNPNWTAINAYWDTINSDVQKYKAGTMTESAFKTKYPIGGRMLVPVALSGGTVTADVEIVGYNHDDLADSSGKAPLTFFCVDLPNIKHCIDNTSAYNQGWPNCDLRTFTNQTVYSALPTQLKSIIKQVNKKCDDGAATQNLVTTADKVWIASVDEIGASALTNTYVSGQGECYSDVFNNTNASRIKYVADTASADRWWLRSSVCKDVNSLTVYRVQTNGMLFGDLITNSFYVAFGFCI